MRPAAPDAPDSPMAPFTEATGIDRRPNTSTIASASCRSSDRRSVRRADHRGDLVGAERSRRHSASRIALTRPAPSAGQPFSAVFDAVAPTPTISP